MTKKEEIEALVFLAINGTKITTIAAQKGIGTATIIAVAEKLRLEVEILLKERKKDAKF